MAPFPAPETGILLTHFVVSEDIARSRDFYANVLGGDVVSESPAVVALANSWIIINSGGGTTDDKPAVTLTAPDPNTTSSFLNIRVANIQEIYDRPTFAERSRPHRHSPPRVLSSRKTCHRTAL